MVKVPQEIQDRNPELEKKFRDFIENLPKQMILRKAGPRGEDIVLPLVEIHGVPVYIAKVELPF